MRQAGGSTCTSEVRGRIIVRRGVFGCMRWPKSFKEYPNIELELQAGAESPVHVSLAVVFVIF